MSLHHRIDYFELPVKDVLAAKHFYSAAFDWTFTDYGPIYAGFGYPGAEREAGGINGDINHTRSPLAIIYSEDLEASEKKVQSAGGKIVKAIFSFPGGRRFHFTDPGGNELAVWSDK
jgi:predicted enzyme related to lactoylglutathione lyase